MPMTKDEIFAAALALPEVDRIKLASRLHESMRHLLGTDIEFDIAFATRGERLEIERERLGIEIY